MIRVAIADDLDMIRTGFELIIDNEPNMSVVASVADGHDIIDVCARRPVDVVLMDIRMPGLDGLAASEQILTGANPPRILILTTFGLDEYVARAVAIGCSGFLLKDATADTLVGAINAVHNGDAVIAPALLSVVFAQARGSTSAKQTSPPGIDDLTERELEVLRRLAAGLSNAEIAERLYLSEATIKTHITRILAKLGVRDRVQAVITAFAAGIADPKADF